MRHALFSVEPFSGVSSRFGGPANVTNLQIEIRIPCDDSGGSVTTIVKMIKEETKREEERNPGLSMQTSGQIILVNCLI